MLAVPRLAETDGSTGPLELASSGGVAADGEEIVQDFVSLHMVSILQPFSDSLRDLQAEVASLRDDAAEGRHLLEAQGLRLRRLEEASGTQEGAAKEVASQVEKALAQIAGLKREQSRQDGNHEMTKAAVAKAKELLSSLSTAVEGAQQELEGHGGRLGSLEVGLVEAEKRVTDHFEHRLDKQGRVVKEVNVRQVEVLKTCEQARALAEASSASSDRLGEEAAQRRTGDAAEVAALSEQLAATASRLLQAEERLGGHDDSLSAVDREVQHLRTWTEQLKDVKQLETRQAELRDSLELNVSRVGQLESDLSLLRAEHCAARSGTDDYGDIRERVAATASEVKQLLKLREVQRTQGETLSSNARRMDDLQAQQCDISARCGSAEAALDSLAGWRGSAARILQDIGGAVDDTRAELTQAHDRLGITSTGLESLRSEASREREALSKLSSRVDMCCKYINGLGKGLQDTHRQMNGAAPGGGGPGGPGGGPRLPALPSTPRSVRASSPSPRRA